MAHTTTGKRPPMNWINLEQLLLEPQPERTVTAGPALNHAQLCEQALSLARQSPEARIWALDINERALALVRENANHLGCKNVRAVREDEIAADLRFSGIWSNPPIRIGKAQLHNLLETWIPRLKPGAAAYLVVQKHLGSDSLQRWLGDRFADEFEVDRIDSQKTFRILRVQRNPQ